MATLVEQLDDAFPHLDERFIALLPAECPDCGAATQISEALTGLKCSNTRCSGRMSMRVKAICTDLNILGFGESTINSFLDTYNPTGPMNIFELTEGMSVGYNVSQKVSDKIIAQVQEIVNNRQFLLWEVVRLMNLPGIQTSAQKVFTGYSDIDEAYNDLHEGGIEWVSTRLGIAGDATVRAVQVYSTLVEYEDEVREACSYFMIVDAGSTPELTVVVSDQAGEGFASKNDFYARCKERFAGRYLFNFAPSVSRKSTQFLIWAGADGSPARYTSKVSKVEGYNASGAEIPIMTGQQFIDFLDRGQDISEAYNWVSAKNEGLTGGDDDPFGAIDAPDVGLM